MAGNSSGMRKAQKTRLAKYGEGRVDPAIRAARKAGTYEKKTVAILDRPFRLDRLTPAILREWKSALQELDTHTYRLVTSMVRPQRRGAQYERAVLEKRIKDEIRHMRQYRRAIETGTAYLEKSHGKERRK